MEVNCLFIKSSKEYISAKAEEDSLDWILRALDWKVENTKLGKDNIDMGTFSCDFGFKVLSRTPETVLTSSWNGSMKPGHDDGFLLMRRRYQADGSEGLSRL